jgi:iron complex outermembrane receptor protein
MRMSRRILAIEALVAGALISASGTAFADNLLEEVVVTAQKREQNVQDVGISITAFTGDTLRSLGVTSSYDIAALTPGVHISGNLAGQNTQFSIRGVTQNDFNDIVEAPNAVYLDEGYIAIAQAQTFGLFDIDRVEVLKGPQGTLFGRNATGGLVQYLSKKPSFNKVEGYGNVTFGEYDTDANAFLQRYEAAIGGPFNDRLAGRVAAMYTQHDGYLKNLYPAQAPSSGLGAGSPGAGAGANLGDDDTYAVRGILDFRANDNLLLRLAVNHARSSLGTGPYKSKSTIGVLDANGNLVNVINTPANETRLSQKGNADGGANAFDGSSFSPGANIGLAGRSVPGGDFFGYLDPNPNGWTTSGDYAFKHQGFTQTTGVDGRVEWDLGGGTSLTSITDYKKYEKSLFIDVDSAPINQLANYAGVHATSWTEELRLAGRTQRTRWVTGLYYLNIDNHSDNGLKAPADSIISDAFGIPAPNGLDIGVVSRLKTDSISLFGQGEYDFSDVLTGILGARLIREKKGYNTLIGVFNSFSNFNFNQGAPIPGALGTAAPYIYSNSDTQNLWAAKAQLDWHAAEGLLVYGGVNRGVKAGSYNAPLLGAYLGSGGNASLPYRPEKLMAYETGFKSTLQGGRTRLNGSVFYYDYKDYQAFLFVGVGGVVINADAHNYGAELELETQVTDGLSFTAAVSKFDATVKNVLLSYGSTLPPRDVKPTYAPELQASVLLRYEWPALGGKVNLRGEATYTDSFFYNLRNFAADQFPAVTMVNAGIGWGTEDKRWEASFDVHNLTDKLAGVQGFDLASLCGCNEVSYQPPRLFSVSLKRAF